MGRYRGTPRASSSRQSPSPELERGVLGVSVATPRGGAPARLVDNHVRPGSPDASCPLMTRLRVRCAHLHIPDRRSRVALIAATGIFVTA